MTKAKLKQTFGKAKLFEIRRLVRRIRQLSLKKGSEQQLAKNKRKVQRLENQLEILKDTKFEEIMKAIDDDQEVQQTCEENDDAKMLVLCKLIKIVRDEKEKLEKSYENKQASRVMKSKIEASSSKSSEEDEEEEVLEYKNFPRHLARGEGEVEKRLKKSTVVSKMPKKRPRCTDDSLDDIGSNIQNPETSPIMSNNTKISVEMKNERKERKKMRINPKKQPFNKFEISENDTNISSDEEELLPRNHLSVNSVFIGSLSSGKDKQDGKMKRDGKNRNGKSKDIKKKGNRLGQRKRREQWERLYGKKANHLKKEKKNNKMKENRKNYSQKNGVFSKKVKKSTAGNNVSSLHPSWEASKSKRKQENIVAFEGQKITFDD